MKILAFYDLKGWAWWSRINNIAKHQPSDIQIDSMKIGSSFDHTNYDLIMVFDSSLTDIISKVPGHKLLLGCSCPKKLDGFIKTMESYKPFAGFVNNAAMYKQSRDHFQNIHLCPNGVDETLFTPAKKMPEKLTACWVGNSKHYAGKGFDEIKQVCKKAGIDLVSYNLSDNKILLPQIELRNMVYHKSGFYVCFSEYEGTPNPALEALSCGLPVITTRVGNMPEIIIDDVNGFLINRNEDALLKCFLKLKKSGLKEMSLNTRKSILNGWTWRDQAINYTRMFTSPDNQNI
jgi:hypothetical protein